MFFSKGAISLRIAMFTDAYIPQANGVAISVHLFRKALERLGHEVYIVSPVGPSFDSKVLVLGGVTFMSEKQHIIAKSGLLPITEFVKKNKVEVIHSHAPFALGFRALAVQKRLRIPHVHTYHTLLVEYRHYIPRPLTPSRRSVEEFSAWFCNTVNRVIAPTERIRKELTKYGVKRPIDVIPTGIDVDLFESEPTFDIRRKLDIPRNSKILLFVGRLAKEKNVGFILQCTKKLLDRGCDVYTIIVGEGPERVNLRKKCRELSLESRIIFTGSLPREELADYYKQADVFVFASSSETQGLVVLESLAAALPVVAVAEMGVGDVLRDGEGVILLDKADLEAFTEKVEMLLNDGRLRERLSVKGREYVKKYWSTEASAKLAERCYKKAILEGAFPAEFTDNLWVEKIASGLKKIPNRLFKNVVSGGARRGSFKYFARSYRR